MASAGNPNQAGAFDLQMLFKPSIPNAQIPISYPTPPSPYPTPPLSGPFSYPPQTPPTFHHYLHYAQEPLANVHAQRPISYPAPSPHLPPPNPNPNPGARLMALLSPNPTANLEPPLPGPAPAAASMAAMLPSVPSQPTPVRLPSSKLPKGRHLVGDRVVYDVDVRLPGELQPQLEVTPITKYVSDPGLVLGRQIAVNRTYICYGLKLGAIRVLNINTALRSLLKGHTQRVTDMAFFAEDVHLLASSSIDGRIFVWKINEGPDEEDKPQITGKVIVAIHMVGDGESFHPRICWHSHKQEILVVAIGNRVLKIDTTKVGKGEVFSAEKPIKCAVEELIDGVQLVGKHEGEVTDLSMCQWMTTRLVSASTDGMVKIWEDRKAVPLVTLRPHDGQPVSSVTFLTAPHRPDHIVLITGGHLNRELKVWASAGEEGWLLPSDSESWKCIQTLDLKSSAEPRAEEAFFNQVIVLPLAGLVLLANAKKNAIYAVHVEYGPSPTATRMDYIAEFTVTMPILSLTGTSDCAPDGEHVVQVYCVQTQAIQQYALDLSQCLPPPLEDAEIEKDSGISRVSEAPRSGGFAALDPSSGNAPIEIPVGSATSKPPQSSAAAIYPAFSGTPEVPSLELATSSAEPNPSALPPATSDVADARVASPPLPMSPRLSGRLSGFRNPSNNFEPGSPLGDRCADPPVLDYSVDRRVDVGRMNVTDVSSLDDSSVKDGTKVGQNDISMVPNSPIAFKHPTHLITPGEILLKAISSSESTLVGQGLKVGEKKVQDVAVNNDIESVEVEVKEVGESGLNQQQELDSQREQRILRAEKKEKTFYTQASDLGIEMARDSCSLSTEISGVEETRQIEDVGVAESFEGPLSAGEQGIQDSSKDVPNTESSSATVVAQSPSSAAKGKKQKVKPSQVAGPSSPSASPFNSADSSNEPGSSNGSPSQEAPFTRIQAIQESMKQLMTIQKEMQKQMTAMVAVPVNKEGRRVEAAMGRSMEKALKSNSDALWARIQEENAKQKLERDRIQQITSSISGSMNKEWPTMFEKALKKEIAAVGPAVARAITPILEKNISSAIADSFQRGVGDKAVNQLEKSVNSKLETAVARQIQSQFQTCGKQALQDALRASLESSVIPAFEQACKGMFEQVDAVFQRGMVEHTSAAQQQFESTHSPLALALRDAMSSASSITQSLSGELADGQRNLLAFMAAGANQQVMNPLAPQQINGPVSGLHDMVEAPLDPKKELERLISEHKYGEAFTSALQRSDVTIVSWLCSKVDLQGILSMLPLPLSQGVLLSLLQQLACDIGNETSRTLEWMRDVLVAIDPVDPTIVMHVRPIFEQVYQILGHQRTLPITAAAETNNIRLIMHVINSVLMGYK
ncbi:enhancer of mRNA-decapping protein 4-like isoform X2 [Magnolia sinica]|uniref:enhancer of mRNA-decapping protein 4-like isoform X2 n=1 Tax=Magnolia sinica TaxID=86752 RepID=UPI002657DFA4|nr:enhancer of mRNA-decapping protein 4-like isoform X2 [Magnolia sinica]